VRQGRPHGHHAARQPEASQRTRVAVVVDRALDAVGQGAAARDSDDAALEDEERLGAEPGVLRTSAPARDVARLRRLLHGIEPGPAVRPARPGARGPGPSCLEADPRVPGRPGSRSLGPAHGRREPRNRRPAAREL
jgi:hypothetical protein